MRDEHAELLERAGIEQQLQALAGRQAALRVELRDPLGAAAGERFGAPAFELGLG